MCDGSKKSSWFGAGVEEGVEKLKRGEIMDGDTSEG